MINKFNNVEFLVGKNFNLKFKCLDIYNEKVLNFISDLANLLTKKKRNKKFS